MEEVILKIQSLYKYFPVQLSISERIAGQKARQVRAVDGVDLEIQRGEILALVGESGSGKTTVGMNVLGIQIPTKGRILLNGYNVAHWAHGHLSHQEREGGDLQALNHRQQILLLRRKAQMVFQDPYESLNPRQTIYQIVAEPLEIHKITESEEEKRQLVRKALEDCGLSPADHFWDRYPDELSGGQRQRRGAGAGADAAGGR